VSQVYERADGFRLGPGETAILALHVRPIHAGTWTLRAERVDYEVGGEEFFDPLPRRGRA